MKFLKLFIPLALCSLLSACIRSNDSRDILAVSIEPQRAWLEALVGEQYNIIVLMPAGENPETFEPSASAMAQLEKAKIWFAIGTLPFEQKMQPRYHDKYVNTGEGVGRLYGTHSHGDANEHHQESDPHIWTSVRNARIMVMSMSDALCTAAAHRAANIDFNGSSPTQSSRSDSASIQAAVQRYIAHLDSLDSDLSARLLGKGAFMVWHPSLSYFARDYDLEQVAVSPDNKELSAKALKGVIEEARADSVTVFLLQRQFDARQASTICAEIGARQVIFNPLAYEWEEELRRIADEMCRE